MTHKHGISDKDLRALHKAGLGVRKGGRRYGTLSLDAKAIIGLSARDRAEERGYTFHRTTKTAAQFMAYLRGE